MYSSNAEVVDKVVFVSIIKGNNKEFSEKMVKIR